MQKVISKKEIKNSISNKNVLNEKTLRLKELQELSEGLQNLNEATFGERLKYLAAKYLPSYKVGDKILGGAKERKRMQDEIQKLMDAEAEGFLKKLNSDIEKNFPDFPNNEEKEEFLKGVLAISAVYDTIIAATQRSNSPITPEQANEYIENLRKYVNYMMSYKINRTIYSTMNENYNESEDIQLGEGSNSTTYVEYHSDMRDEDPFMMHGEKWQFVNAIYPDGKKDIGVYRYAGDIVYSYEWFRRNVVGDKSMGELDEATMADIQGGLSSASVKRALAADRGARGGMSGEDEYGSEAMTGLKSNRLPLTLGVVGAVLAAAGWVGQSQWFIDFIKGLKEVDVKLTQDIIERNIKIDPRGFSYTLQNNLPAGEAVNLNFNQPVENLRKALEFYGNGDLRQGVNASSLFIDPSQRASSVSNLLQQLSDPSNKTIGDIFNVGENTYGRAGTLFSQYGGAKGVIAKYFVNRIITTTAKWGTGYVVGGALIAAAPALMTVGIGAMVAGALVKAMRIKGQKSSRVATLNTLLQSLRPIPIANPVVPQEGKPEDGEQGSSEQGGETTDGGTTSGGDTTGGGEEGGTTSGGDTTGGGEGQETRPKPKKTPLSDLRKVLRNLFTDVYNVKQSQTALTEAENKKVNYIKKGGLDNIGVNLDKADKQIFVKNMGRMMAVARAVNRLNLGQFTDDSFTRMIQNVRQSGIHDVMSDINDYVDKNKDPEFIKTFIVAYNSAVKTGEFKNLKKEIDKNLDTILEAFKPTAKTIERLKNQIVDYFTLLFTLFKKVNQLAAKESTKTATVEPTSAPTSGENKVNDQSQEAPTTKKKKLGEPIFKGGPTGPKFKGGPKVKSNLSEEEEVNEAKKKNKYSKKASEFIGKEISHLKKDKGYPQDRAVAAAINVAKEKGMKVGTKKKKSK